MKIVCTQPFNKHVKYGLAFVTVTSVDSSGVAAAATDDSSTKKVTKLGAFMLKASPNNSDDEEEPKVGNLFASFKADPSKKAKPSVAGELRASGTLAAMTVKASGLADAGDSGGFAAQKKDKKKDPVKRKALDHPVSTPSSAKKPRDDKAKLPARNVIDPGFDDKKDDKINSKQDSRKNGDDTNKTSDKKKTPAKVKPPPPQPKPKKTKPFAKLFEGVRFVLSGYQNPQRSDIRDKALKMGATYRGDWDPSCSHLVCAFMNTPKYNQVKGQSRNAKVGLYFWTFKIWLGA